MANSKHWLACRGGGHVVILTSRVTAVGRYHQEFRKGVFDDVLPVDGVGMAQEFVLVHQDATVQYFCRGRKNIKG